MEKEIWGEYSYEMFEAVQSHIKKMLEENENQVQILDILNVTCNAFLISLKNIYHNIKSEKITWDKFSRDIQSFIKQTLETL